MSVMLNGDLLGRTYRQRGRYRSVGARTHIGPHFDTEFGVVLEGTTWTFYSMIVVFISACFTDQKGDRTHQYYLYLIAT